MTEFLVLVIYWVLAIWLCLLPVIAYTALRSNTFMSYIIAFLSGASLIVCLTIRKRLLKRVIGCIGIFAFLYLLFLFPFEIYFKQGNKMNVKILPIGYGLPTAETIEREKRGEIALGGCVHHFFAPRWKVLIEVP